MVIIYKEKVVQVSPYLSCWLQYSINIEFGSIWKRRKYLGDNPHLDIVGYL